MQLSHDDRFADAMQALFRTGPPARIGLAVSGGGDSMALLSLAQGWAARAGVTAEVATVDHRLRPESRAEAAMVADRAAALGLTHRTLIWTDPHGAGGNLSDRARRARYGLLRDWAARRGLDAVLLGHTLDDQAETLLMRLARGSGVDGLSAMAARTAAGAGGGAGNGGPIAFLRPLLGFDRQTLRDHLTARGWSWVDDPSNDDPAYDRVKARRALAALAPLGIDAAGLAATAGRMARARSGLEARARQAARDLLRVDRGCVRIAAPGLWALDEETRFRLLARALMWVAGQPYRPRLAALERLAEAAAEGRGGVLHGARLLVRGDALFVHRELAAIAPDPVPADAVWDGRWRIEGAPRAARLSALGAADLPCVPCWRSCGLPRPAVLTLPALRVDGALFAVPHLGFGPPLNAIWHGQRWDFAI
ncbi:MAG: tRNA lysidine(34) synthetase TilS [Sagittula sp.]|uniref:tRNA lysidine(34) synthetase TilS n=1 Tax=Sagittula sp. TaxID=2038081 RepID=UPI0040588BEA